MSDLHFRIATAGDTSLIATLVNNAYRGDNSRLSWTTEADLLSGQRTDPRAIGDILGSDNNVILLCYRQQQAIGTAHLRRDAGTCHFGMFTVQPGLQGQGIGKQFIAHAEHYARDTWGCATMSMTVITLRQELLQWYERRGYINSGEHAEFPYGDERFGLPRRDDLQLVILEKSLIE